MCRSLTVLVALTLAACAEPEEVPAHRRIADGDPQAGKALIERYGCGSCHVIPGVRNAQGTVGPPLTQFALRSYIAGVVPNRPDALTRWIQDPPAIAPDTAMPNLGVDRGEARHIAAYLYTLTEEAR